MTKMWPGLAVLLMHEFVLYLILLIVLFLGVRRSVCGHRLWCAEEGLCLDVRVGFEDRF